MLHDQVSLRAAASLEHRLPAPDAARQTRAAPQGRAQFPRQAAVEYARTRQHRGNSGGGRNRQRRERHEGGAQTARGHARRRRHGADPEIPFEDRQQARTQAGRRRHRDQGDRRDARQGGAVRHLLRRSQRAAHAGGPDRGFPAQRHRRESGRQGKVLRHAQARARRSRDGGEVQELQHPAVEAAHRRGLRHRRADSFLRAHVQAGVAADVSGDADVQAVKEHIFDPFEYLMLRHKAGLLRTDFKETARQGELPRALSSARAEHRPEDPRRAQAGARYHR